MGTEIKNGQQHIYIDRYIDQTPKHQTFESSGQWTVGFPGGSEVENLPANAGEQVQSLGQEDPLEKEMAT